MDMAQRLRQSQFLKQNTIFFFGSVAVGALNYLYYPVIGRLMQPTAFGEVQAIISLFLQAAICLGVISLVAVNIVTNASDETERNALVLEFEKLGLLVGVALLVATILASKQLQEFLQFNSALPFILLTLSLVFAVPFTVRSAFLRGKQKFGLVSLGNLAGAGGKILFSALLVIAGLGTAGAIGGLLLAQILASVLVAIWAFRMGLHRPSKPMLALPNMRVLLPELRYGFFVLVGSLSITLLYTLDIIIVKHYFDAHTAGLYAGIATIARILFFLTVSVSQVLMPSVRVRNSPQQNRQFLRKSVMLFGLLSALPLCIFVAFPKVVVNLMMGTSYEAFSPLLPRLGLAIFIISFLNLIITYYLALRRYGVALVALLGAIATCVFMLASHSSIAGVVNGLLFGSATMLGLLIIWAASTNPREEAP